MKAGDKVIVVFDTSNPDSITEFMVTKIQKDYVYGTQKEQIYNIAFVFPSSAKEKLKEICKTRQRLKKIFDDSIAAIYELRNAVNRGEYA